jgi:hypothetical protein
LPRSPDRGLRAHLLQQQPKNKNRISLRPLN